jgi:hypothetical protein
MSGIIPRIGEAERELLIYCARVELSDALVERTWTLLRSDLDWDSAVRFAEAHSVAALLHRHLQRLSGWAEVPPTARQRLLQLTHRTEYRNRLYSAALAELLELFTRGGVPVIVLKGLSLVELIYADLSLRPLIDLNLLVPENHLRAAKALLLQRGYVETLSRGSRFYHWSHSQLVLEKPGQFRVLLMLQWDVVTWRKMHALDLPRFWRDAQPVQLSGRHTRSPSPTDFALYLCLQADKYAFLNASAVDLRDPAELVFDDRTDNRLIRFTDLHEVIRHYEGSIDWGELADRARAGGIEGSVYGSLRGVERLFRSAALPAVLKALRPAPARGLRPLLCRTVLDSKDGGSRSTLEAWLGNWWLKQDPMTRRRWIKLVDLIEFTFPRWDVLRRRHQPAWGGAAVLAYPFHVGATLLRCVLHLPTWAYYRVRALRSSGIQPASPALVSGRPVRSDQAVGPS